MAGASDPNGQPNGFIDEDGVKWVKSRCFFCSINCAILVGSKNGKIVKMYPNEDHGTLLCERIGEKGERAIKFHYHPKRINHALKRAGDRGENKWIEIPYEQALDEIAEKLTALKEKYGPETLAVTEGTYRSDHLWARCRFSNLWGNPSNIADPGTVCWCWMFAVNMAVVGNQIETTLTPGVENSKCLVIWGQRPNERFSPKGYVNRVMKACMENPETKVIVIDPVMIDAVRNADVFLQVRPGTDLALMLGWCNVILTEKLYNEDFLKQWSNGSFLVRMDTGKILRETDIFNVDFSATGKRHQKKGGNRDNFVAWDMKEQRTAVWLSAQNKFRRDGVENALEGEYEIQLTDGNKVKCKTGFTLLMERIAEYTPERVSEITSVPAPKIRTAARMYATELPGTISWGVGSCDQSGWNATYAGLAKTLLRAFTGNVDALGGDYLPEVGPIINGKIPVRESELELAEKVTPEARAKFIGNDRFRMMSWKGFEAIDKCYREMWKIPRPQVHHLLVTAPLLWRAMLNSDPYPVRALISWAGNPMMWAPNTKMVYKALKSLDLLVSVEYFMTPTAALADYVLPAADWMERPMCTTFEDSFDFMMGGDRAVLPEADRRMDYDFFRGLGMRLGQKEYWPDETFEENITNRLSRCGVSYEDFVDDGLLVGDLRFEKYKTIREDGQLCGFATPSRRVEIYPSIFEDLNYDPLPSFKELPETPVSNPELAKEYPIILTTGGRFVPMFHSEHRVPGTGTREMHPWPIFQMHFETARELGIRDGDWCWIETPRGRIRQKAKLGFELRPGTIIAQPSWWYPELPVEEPWLCGAFISNVNVLTNDDPDHLDPMCGNWTNRGLLCKVYRCEEPEYLADRLPIEMFHEGESGFPKSIK
jgi:anaerobic selenocysteine-containing dehydrogenase